VQVGGVKGGGLPPSRSNAAHTSAWAPGTGQHRNHRPRSTAAPRRGAAAARPTNDL